MIPALDHSECSENTTIDAVGDVLQERVKALNLNMLERQPRVAPSEEDNRTTSSASATTASTKSREPVNRKNKPKKTVRFARPLQTQVTYTNLPPACELKREERKQIWWREKDFNAFRSRARKLAGHLRTDAASQRRIGHLLESGGCYSKAQYWAMAMPSEDELEEFLQDGCSNQVRNLVQWDTISVYVAAPEKQEAKPKRASPRRLSMSSSSSNNSSNSNKPNLKEIHARGLEHWISMSYYEDRRHAMEEAKMVVLALSRNKESSEELAKQYAEYSRPSRILARFWGEADQEAAVVVGNATTSTGATSHHHHSHQQNVVYIPREAEEASCDWSSSVSPSRRRHKGEDAPTPPRSRVSPSPKAPRVTPSPKAPRHHNFFRRASLRGGGKGDAPPHAAAAPPAALDDMHLECKLPARFRGIA